MAGLGQTVSQLMLQRMRDAALRAPTGPVDLPLALATPVGSNPGQLRMWTFVPPGLPRGAPLVVVLHGCLQAAAGFDAGSGWSALARRHGFALLYPEQLSSNNANGCFNWFQHEDTTRDHGEVASIAQMIGQMVETHCLDPARVYVVGLSAGGAMAAAMLATYPELFAGGAIIAGLPYGAASSMGGALEAMRHCRSRAAREWGDLVRRASPPVRQRPQVQIWHGAADQTVHSEAADELVKQWCDVAGVSGPGLADQIGDVAHESWRGTDGRIAVESFTLPGVGHGVPLHSEDDDFDESVGLPGAYMLEAGIGSTRRIAESWGLITQPALTRPASAGRDGSAAGKEGGDNAGIAGVIGRALRASGLMS